MSIHHHTLRVSFLRTILPVVAIVLLVAVAAWPVLNEFRQNQMNKYSLTRAKIDSIAMTMPSAGKPAQLEVTHPQYTGRDDKGQPYILTANTAAQGMQKGSPVTLDKPVATLILDPATKAQATLQGDTGVYDPKAKTLQLNKDIVLTHSDGYTINTQDLFIDLDAGSSVTKTPIIGVGPGGQLEGESGELRDRGDHIILHGKSRVILTPAQS